jgi:hypothetical protein
MHRPIDPAKAVNINRRRFMYMPSSIIMQSNPVQAEDHLQVVVAESQPLHDGSGPHLSPGMRR